MRNGKNPKESPALQFLAVLWSNALEGTGHSWERLNHGMAGALHVAIKTGLHFDLEDFAAICERFRFGYWCGVDGSTMTGERFYTSACEVDNLSACQSFEKWKERPPFVCEGRRLHIGAELRWEGLRCKVTSFAQDCQSIGACHYKLVQDRNEHWQEKVLRKFKITIESLRASEREREKTNKAAKVAAGKGADE